MKENKQIVRNDLTLILERFDEDLNSELGASYHGYNLVIQNTCSNEKYHARKYDDEDYIYFVDKIEDYIILEIFNLFKNDLGIKGYKVYDQKVVYIN